MGKRKDKPMCKHEIVCSGCPASVSSWATSMEQFERRVERMGWVINNDDGPGNGYNHCPACATKANGNTPDSSVSEILSEVFTEVRAQWDKWGLQTHPLIHSCPLRHGGVVHYGVSNYLTHDSEDSAKRVCDDRFRQGSGSFADIIVEELAEAIEAEQRFLVLGEKPRQTRKELIQTAACVVSAILALQLREGGGK